MNTNFRMPSPGATASSSTGSSLLAPSSGSSSGAAGSNESYPPPAPSSGAASSSSYSTTSATGSSSSPNHLQPPSGINPNGTRSRSASQPIRYLPGAAPPPLSPGSLGRTSSYLPGSPSSSTTGSSGGVHKRSVSRSLSSNAINKVQSSSPGLSALLSGSGSGLGLSGDPFSTDSMPGGSGSGLQSGSGRSKPKPPSAGRARSSSLVTVTEVGGDDEPEGMVDRLGQGNENAAWVNAPGELLASCAVRILFRGSGRADADPTWKRPPERMPQDRLATCCHAESQCSDNFEAVSATSRAVQKMALSASSLRGCRRRDDPESTILDRDIC